MENGNIGGKQSVERLPPSRGVHPESGLEMDNLAARVDARVGPAGRRRLRSSLVDPVEDRFEDFLDRSGVRLNLPSVIGGPVVLEKDPNEARLLTHGPSRVEERTAQAVGNDEKNRNGHGGKQVHWSCPGERGKIQPCGGRP